MEAILKREVEHKLVWAFIGLNALDAFLSMLLASKGYLYGELNPIMRHLLASSYGWFWLGKMGLALICVPVFYLLARIAPRIRVLIFTLPVVAMICVCAFNAFGLVYWTIIYGNLL